MIRLLFKEKKNQKQKYEQKKVIFVAFTDEPPIKNNR